MRYGVVSDLHANSPAWKAVQLDLASVGVDRIVCLGDVVGYGPDPAEVLESAHAAIHHFVLGNHDAVLCGKMDEDLFSDAARTIVRWTRGQLGSAAVRVFAGWPLMLTGPGFRCAHADFARPALFPYLVEAEDAAASWAAVPEPLLFVGHSHCPAIHVIGASGTPHRIAPQDFVLEAGKRYIVNVGSVGQSRYGDPRASYCLYDAARGTVHWRRIPFDLDAYRRAVERAGLPRWEGDLLDLDPRKALRPLRERLDFRPPSAASKAAKNVIDVLDVSTLRRRVRRWQAASVTMAAALLAAAAGGAALWLHRAGRTQTIAGGAEAPIEAAARPAEVNLLSWPAEAVEAGRPVPGWTVRLGDRRAQGAAVETGGDAGPRLILESRSAAHEMAVSSGVVLARPGDRFAAEVLFRPAEGFEGSIALAVSVERASGGRLDQFVVKEPNLRRREGWRAARETFEMPAGARSMRVHLRGRFAGRVEIAGASLVRK